MRLLLLLAVCLGALAIGAGCEEKKTTAAGSTGTGGGIIGTPKAPGGAQ